MTIKLLMKPFFSILLVTFYSNSFNQTPVELTKKYKEKYKHKKVVLLKDHMTIDIALNKEGDLDISKTIAEENVILDQKASIYNQGLVQFSDLISLNYIHASTLVPEDKKYKEIKVSEELYSTKDKIGGSVFYDDTKEMNFIFPQLKLGAIKKLEYQLEIKEPRFLGKFFFQSSKPAEDVLVEVVVDQQVDLGFKLFNIDTFDIDYKKEIKKGRVHHTWQAKNINEFNYESSALSGSYYLPHIVFFIKEYQHEGKSKKLLSSVEDLHHWYYTLIKDVNTQNNMALEKIVDTLVLNTKTDLEKVQNIYAWVQENIKYIAIEDGYSGFIPREAIDICDKRYGDCKDMSSIITEMLEIAGVKAQLTWVGTRDIPYKYTEVFTPSVDNHMIATYTDEKGKTYFLDATSSYLPFGIVSEFIQGKQAMVNLGDGDFKLVDVPITPAEINLIYDSVNIKLQEDRIVGDGLYSVSGYPKVQLSYTFPPLTANEKKEYVKGLDKGNNKFTVSSTQDFNFDQKDKPSKIQYDFKIDNYINKADDEIYINLHLDKFLKGNQLEKDRFLPFDTKHKYINKQIVQFEIPENYRLELKPENAQMNHKSFSFDIKYVQQGQNIKLISKIKLNTILIKPEEFEAWNTMIEQLTNNYSEVIVLKKKP